VGYIIATSAEQPESTHPSTIPITTHELEGRASVIATIVSTCLTHYLAGLDEDQKAEVMNRTFGAPRATAQIEFLVTTTVALGKAAFAESAHFSTNSQMALPAFNLTIPCLR